MDSQNFEKIPRFNAFSSENPTRVVVLGNTRFKYEKTNERIVDSHNFEIISRFNTHSSEKQTCVAVLGKTVFKYEKN